MAVNLENLLPQAYLDSTPPLVPSNGAEDSLLGDLFSPTSMYGSEGLSFLGGLTDSVNLDVSFLKSDYSALSLAAAGESMQYVDGEETLYQTNSSDFFSNSWMTTPMSLPLTPDEPLRDNNIPIPTTNSQVPPPITATPIFTGHPVPLTPESLVSPHHVPLTPESLVSPQSSCDGEELDEVLSYFSDSTPNFASCDEFGGFPPSGAVAEHFSPSHLYHDDSSSLHSSHTSLMSSPTSTPSMSPSPASFAFTPMPSPPTSLALHPITPSDTIRNLLAREHAHSSQNECVQDEVTYKVRQATSEPTPRGVNFRKRECNEAGSIGGNFTASKKRPCKGGGGGTGSRGKRRVSLSVKKERKREQNKTAALRYRQKKKDEKIDYNVQQQTLEERNAMLRTTLASLEAEVSYLKHLWTEVDRVKQRGLVA